MGAGPIAFSYSAWTATFPELAGVSEVAATNYFGMATLYIRNDGGGPINDPNMLTSILNLTTAHLARLFSQQTNGVPTTGGQAGPNPVVGRVASASEGSVSAQLDIGDQPPGAAWWMQTPYGAAVWQALRPYRTFRYIGSTKRRFMNPPGRYWGRLGGI